MFLAHIKCNQTYEAKKQWQRKQKEKTKNKQINKSQICRDKVSVVVNFLLEKKPK